MPNQTIVIDSNRIQQIGPPAQVHIPANAQIVKAEGKFMIPGLWDAHVHLDSLLGSTPAVSERLARRVFLPLLVANGITGVRDMGSLGGFEPVLALRRDISLGVLVGPRIIAPGPAFDGTVQHRGPHAVTGATEGGRAVIAMKEAGADFVKVMSLVPRDAFFAIADEAKKQNLSVVGHVPESVSATEASDAGQRSMEHLLDACDGLSFMTIRSFGRARTPRGSSFSFISEENDHWRTAG